MNVRDSEIVAGVLQKFGYNAQTGMIEKMVKSGIIDPKKATRLALENSASIVRTIKRY